MKYDSTDWQKQIKFKRRKTILKQWQGSVTDLLSAVDNMAENKNMDWLYIFESPSAPACWVFKLTESENSKKHNRIVQEENLKNENKSHSFLGLSLHFIDYRVFAKNYVTHSYSGQIHFLMCQENWYKSFSHTNMMINKFTNEKLVKTQSILSMTNLLRCIYILSAKRKAPFLNCSFFLESLGILQ